MEKDLKLFIGKLVQGAEIVHNVQLQGSQRKFEIIKLVEAEKWDRFDKDRHTVGAFIAWDLKYSQVKVNIICSISSN